VLTGHSKWVRSLAFSPDGKTLGTASWDNSIRLWDLAGGIIRVIREPVREVEHLAFSPDGSLLAAVDETDGSIWLLNALDGTPIRELPLAAGLVLDADFSPDGSMLAVASQDGTINLWGIAGPARAGGK
jgi:WD40 repeat protein